MQLLTKISITITSMAKQRDSEHEEEVLLDDDIEVVAEESGEHHAPSKIKALKDQIKALKAEKQEYLTGWQSARAELVNTKRRMEEEHAAKRVFLNAGLIEELLPVADSFAMAIGNTEAWEKVDENWRRGIEYIRAQFDKVLEQHGVTRIKAEGEAFDPTRHESIEDVITEDKDKDNIVMATRQEGYELNGRVLRPAKVTVYTYQTTTNE